MCGFVGQVGQAGSVGTLALCRRIRHRGPDDIGEAPIASGALSACRLALQSSKSERQPLASASGDCRIAYNGEIYNSELMAQRWLRGSSVEASSDTAILLESLCRGGTAALRGAEGMYAAAFAGPGATLLFRDPFGIKPLYYWSASDRMSFCFASEVKALLGAPEIPRRIEPQAWAEQLVLGCPLDHRTLFSEIKQIVPGHPLSVEVSSGGTIRLAGGEPVSAASESDARAEQDLEHALTDSVRRCIESADREVGLLLSGGIDSTIVAALHPDPVGKLAFTVTDGGDGSGEVETARLIARHFGFKHEVIRLDPAAAWHQVPASVCAHEQPRTYSAVHAAGGAIAQQVRAVLTGDGADELFRGYRIHRSPAAFIARAEARATAIATLFPAAQGLLGPALRLLADMRRSPRSVDDFLLTQLLVQKHLKLWDKGGMAHSVEVRLPFLTPTVLRAARRAMPAGTGNSGAIKAPLREILARRLPWGIGSRVLRRPKTAVTAATAAIRSHFMAQAERVMPSAHRNGHPFRRLAENPLDLLSTDLFLHAFICHGGVTRPGLTVEAVYGEELGAVRNALDELESALRG